MKFGQHGNLFSCSPSTGFTHSLQSLELDPDKIKHAFNKPPATPETCYSQYIANRGMVEVTMQGEAYDLKLDFAIIGRQHEICPN